MQTIIQVSSLAELKDLLASVGTNTLVLLDIDDTLIAPKSAMFRVNGHPDFIDELKKRSHEIKNFEHVLSTWRSQRQVVLVDENWPHVIEMLRHKGAAVYGFTQVNTGAFGVIPSMEEWRYKELYSLGLHFTPQAAGFEAFNLLEGKDGYACFYKGIMMTGPFSKRQMLENFLIATGLQPEHILMFDDRLAQGEAIIAFLREQGITCTFVHYQGAMELTGDADPDVIGYQQKCLLNELRWLEDEEARAERNNY